MFLNLLATFNFILGSFVGQMVMYITSIIVSPGRFIALQGLLKQLQRAEPLSCKLVRVMGVQFFACCSKLPAVLYWLVLINNMNDLL